MIRILCVSFLLFIGSCGATDQILPASFQKIFIYAAKANVVKLTKLVNNAKTTKDGVEIVDNWAPSNWKKAGAKPNSSNRLSNLTLAIKQCDYFLYHRAAMQIFSYYLVKTTVSSDYLTAAEAQTMKDIFWKADTTSKNVYKNTRALFKKNAAAVFAKTHADFATKFEKLSTAFKKENENAAKLLNWKVQTDMGEDQRHYSIVSF